MTTIRAAVEALRTSREALPAELQLPWERVGHKGLAVGVYAPSGFGAYSSAADCDNDEPEDAEIAAHIALVASPHVVQALEELLEASYALEDFDDEKYENPLAEWADRKARWRTTLRHLEHAITRRTP